MRGTGYAIGEILIFLAIATIIGFLLGWVMFYRRPGTGSKLSPSNPNHVRQLESRAKAVENKMSSLDKKATALLATLSKAPRQPTPATAGTVVPAAAAPTADQAKKDVAQQADKAKDEAAAKADQGKQDVAHAKDQAAAKADEAKKAADQTADKAKDEIAAKADEAKKAADQTADKAKDAVGATAAPAEEIDGYLSEADDRISKLEDTLDKLSEKLAELEDE